jgi:GT2 family glycosyltransferase
VRIEPFDADPSGHDFLRRASASRGLCARTDSLRRFGGFDPAMPVSEDIDLLLRMTQAGERPLFLPQPLVRIHEHAGPSLSRDANAARHAAASQRLWQQHKAFFRSHRSLWRHYGGVLAANLYRAGRRDEARRALRELASRVDALPRAIEIWIRFEWRARFRTTPAI